MTPRRFDFSAIIHPPAHVQWGVILLLLVAITVAHNVIHLAAAPLVMILVQKLYFVPVILAGFWSGLRGGLLVAAIALVLYPHQGGLLQLAFGEAEPQPVAMDGAAMTMDPNMDHSMMVMDPAMDPSMPMDHSAMGHAMGDPDAIFSAGQSSDMVLLFVVALMTGWLRNLLQRELLLHQKTAEERDAALSETRRTFELARRSEHLASLGQMAAGVAHEVRNPLTGMQGAVDILRRSGWENRERATLLLDRLQASIAHLDELTRHFLQFARPPKSDLRPIEPCAIAGQAAQLLRPQAEAAGLQIAVHGGETGRTIRADSDQIRQVLVNLLLNAIHFAETGSEVRLDCRFAAGFWQASIDNLGPEIAPEERERIFDPFHTTRAEGTGLGLAIVARIVEAHGGAIRCDSENGHTTFTLTIPEASE